METLNKLREPLALLALIGLALRVVITLASAGIYAGEDGFGSFAGAANLLSYRSGDPVLVVVLTALVTACVVGERSRHVRALTLAAVVTVGASVLLGAVFSLAGLASGGPTAVIDTSASLLVLLVPVVCGTLLVQLLRSLPAGQPQRAPYGLPATPAPPPYGQLPPGPAFGQPQPDPQYQPVWQPDVAAGAAWYTAGDAASGAPAAGWGTPGQAGGWQPSEPPQPGAPNPTDGPGPQPWKPNPS